MLPFRRRQIRRRGLLAGGLAGYFLGKRRGQGATGGNESAPDRFDELEQLAELRDRGVLTPEEFEREKRKLLS